MPLSVRWRTLHLPRQRQWHHSGFSVHNRIRSGMFVAEHSERYCKPATGGGLVEPADDSALTR
jgi:hypothetical protein